jgi:hypothetical protein
MEGPRLVPPQLEPQRLILRLFVVLQFELQQLVVESSGHNGRSYNVSLYYNSSYNGLWPSLRDIFFQLFDKISELSSLLHPTSHTGSSRIGSLVVWPSLCSAFFNRRPAGNRSSRRETPRKIGSAIVLLATPAPISGTSDVLELALPLAGEDPSLSSRSISSISANRRYACSAAIRCAWRSLNHFGGFRDFGRCICTARSSFCAFRRHCK